MPVAHLQGQWLARPRIAPGRVCRFPFLSHQRPAGLSRARSAPQDPTASALYRAPLLLVEILILLSALHVSNCKPAVGHSLWLCLRHSASITSSIWGVLSIQSQAHSGSLVRYISMSSASDYRPTMGPLFCICPCPQHWTAGPLWVSLLYSVYLLCSRHQTTSPLRATCPYIAVYVHTIYGAAWTASPLATCSN
jgi:hypothetical protein